MLTLEEKRNKNGTTSHFYGGVKINAALAARIQTEITVPVDETVTTPVELNAPIFRGWSTQARRMNACAAVVLSLQKAGIIPDAPKAEGHTSLDEKKAAKAENRKPSPTHAKATAANGVDVTVYEKTVRVFLPGGIDTHSVLGALPVCPLWTYGNRRPNGEAYSNDAGVLILHYAS